MDFFIIEDKHCSVALRCTNVLLQLYEKKNEKISLNINFLFFELLYKVNITFTHTPIFRKTPLLPCVILCSTTLGSNIVKSSMTTDDGAIFS